MRDLAFGVGGVVLGGTIGVVGLLACEALAGLVVAGFLLASPAAPPAPVQRAPTEVAATPPQRAASAAAGEVQLHTLAIVRVLLDGEPMVYDPATGAYIARVAPGEHRLQLLEPLGTGVKAEASVVVESGRRSQLRYAKGALTDQGTMPVASASRARPAAVEAPLVVEVPTVELPTIVLSEELGAEVMASATEVSAATRELDPMLTIGPDGARVQTPVGAIKVRMPKLSGRQ